MTMSHQLEGTPKFTRQTTVAEMELWDLMPTLDYGFTDLPDDPTELPKAITQYDACWERLVFETSTNGMTDDDLPSMLDMLTERLTDVRHGRDDDQRLASVGRVLKHARALFLKLVIEANREYQRKLGQGMTVPHYKDPSWARCIDTAMIWEWG